MTARLRVLPVFCAREGESSHYLVLDPGEGGEWPEGQGERLESSAEAMRAGGVQVLLVFAFPVDLPCVDEPASTPTHVTVTHTGDDPEV